MYTMLYTTGVLFSALTHSRSVGAERENVSSSAAPTRIERATNGLGSQRAERIRREISRMSPALYTAHVHRVPSPTAKGRRS
jgi:hypothetical protein